jgi:hypothetical protein
MQATTVLPQCALANRETEFLLRTGDTAQKLSSHCGDQPPCHVLIVNALNVCTPRIKLMTQRTILREIRAGVGSLAYVSHKNSLRRF